MTIHNYLWDLFRKRKAERKKEHCAIEIVMYSSLHLAGNLSQLGSCYLLQYGLFYLFYLKLWMPPLLIHFSEHLRSRNINNSLRKAAISFFITNCCEGTGFCRVILLFAFNIFLYIMFLSCKLRLSFSLFKPIYKLDAQHCFLPLVKKGYWTRPFIHRCWDPIISPYYACGKYGKMRSSWMMILNDANPRGLWQKTAVSSSFLSVQHWDHHIGEITWKTCLFE